VTSGLVGRRRDRTVARTWATQYAKTPWEQRGDGSREPHGPWGRGGDEGHCSTNGRSTTGMPKGVMWAPGRGDMFARLKTRGGVPGAYTDGAGRLDGVPVPNLEANGPGMTLLPACPG